MGSLPAELGSTVKVLRKPVAHKPFLVITGEAKAVERYFTWRLWVARVAVLAALAALTSAFLPWR